MPEKPKMKSTSKERMVSYNLKKLSILQHLNYRQSVEQTKPRKKRSWQIRKIKRN